MKVAFVSSEVVPFAKTGGLADVAGALPAVLNKKGVDVKVFMPKYYSVDENRFNLIYDDKIGEFYVRTAGKPRPVNIYRGEIPGSDVEVIFIDCPYYFHRHQLYTDQPDEDERFILFSKAVIETIQRIYWTPDVIHCNDWQTGLIPLFIKDNYSWDRIFNNVATVLTIHNIGYQGKFSPVTVNKSEIRGSFFSTGGPVEHNGDVNFLKAGIEFADVLNTVSPNYAKELLTEEYGSGLDKVLFKRKDDFHGILNGVDYNIWSPEKDRFLVQNYSTSEPEGKKDNKKALLKKAGLPYSEKRPVIGIVSRMAIQKGFDIIADSIDKLLGLDMQLVILGSGEKEYEDMFRKLEKENPKKLAAFIGFDNELAHRIEAGSDMFLMPSHYEPCGLNQIYSLKYGTVPIVRKTGGLADTVTDYDSDSKKGTGFVFEEYTGEALYSAVERAVNYFRDKKTWKKIMKNGMTKDFSWQSSAAGYIELYKKAVTKRRGV